MQQRSFSFFSSSVGSKIVMAVTGILLILFMVGHLIGNLSVYSGPEAVNAYAKFLHSMPLILWKVRIGLLLVFVLHIWTSIRLSLKNKAARPIAYTRRDTIKATLASRTMVLSGLVVLSFVIFHLAHFTWGLVTPESSNLTDAQGRHDVYSMMVLGFQNIYLVLFYLIAQGFLGLHISHGFSSAPQTLGLSQNSCTALWLRRIGVCFAILVVALYSSIPLSIWFGFITL